MQRIVTSETKSAKLIESIKLANNVLEDSDFYTRLSKIKGFDYSDITEEVLSKLIFDSQKIASVIIKRKQNPFSAATAYTKPAYPTLIFIYNSYLTSKEVNAIDIACTLIHEFVHLIDYESADYDFGHGNNYNAGKENTAPYAIEKVTRDIIENKF